MNEIQALLSFPQTFLLFAWKFAKFYNPSYKQLWLQQYYRKDVVTS